MMSLTVDTKQEVLEAAISGLSRVAKAILATPNEARAKALDAAADSYRQTGRVLGYDDETPGVGLRNHVSPAGRSNRSRVSATQKRAPG